VQRLGIKVCKKIKLSAPKMPTKFLKNHYKVCSRENFLKRLGYKTALNEESFLLKCGEKVYLKYHKSSLVRAT